MQTPEIRQILAYCLQQHPGDIRSMLQMNGVQAQNLSGKELTIATLKAIKDSSAFRQDFAAYVDGRVSETNGNLNLVTTDDDMGMIPASDIPSSVSTSTTEKSGFFSTLGGLFTTDNLNKILNTGLDTLSAKMKADANKSSEQTALQIEQTRLAQIQAANERKGLSTGAIVGIVAGGILIAGVIVYLAMRKK